MFDDVLKTMPQEMRESNRQTDEKVEKIEKSFDDKILELGGTIP